MKWLHQLVVWAARRIIFLLIVLLFALAVGVMSILIVYLQSSNIFQDARSPQSSPACPYQV